MAESSTVMSQRRSIMSENSQSFANHRRFVPPYHFGIFAVLVINLLLACYKTYQALTSEAAFGFAHVFSILMAVSLIGLFLYCRLFALAVQDRVIRLEERLRFAEILPDDLKGRVGELRRDQFVGLRFASDEEVPDLVRDALDNGTGNEEIKKKIKNWRPDDLRA